MRTWSIRLIISLLLLFSVLSTMTVFAETTIPGSPITVNTTWTLSGSPYVVTGSVLVMKGVTLTIEPGVQVKFGKGNALQIEGTLIARGTAGQEILFTANGMENWGYILFSDSSIDASYAEDYLSGSILEYCTVEKAGGVQIDNNGAVRLENAHPFLSHLTVRDNKATGIRGWNLSGMLRIVNSNVHHNDSSSSSTGGIIASGRGTVYLSDNVVTNNSGRGIYLGIDNATVKNNTVANNNASIHQGGGLYIDYGTVAVLDNVIKNNSVGSNTGGGVYNNGGKVNFFNNIVTNNTAYNSGGVYSQGGKSTFSNNLITENVASSSTGGFNCNANATVNNNSIVGNSAPKIAVKVEGGCIFQYNTITQNQTTEITPASFYTIYTQSANTLNYNNLFGNTTSYELWNDRYGSSNLLSAENNWWGTTTESDILAKIHDFFDDSTRGVVSYSPWATTPYTEAPISPPRGLTATTLSTGEIALTWLANPESDTAGYKVYWDTDKDNYPYANMTEVGNVTSYTLTGFKYYVAVTAYDRDYALAKDDPNTIINDNQTNGNESWYAKAIVDGDNPPPPPVVTVTLTVSKTGTGTGTVTGSGIDCGSDCSEVLAQSTPVTLTATPDANSTLAGWSEAACSNTQTTCTVVLDQEKTVTVTYNEIPPTTVTLTVSKTGIGTGTVTGSGIDCGSDCSEVLVQNTPITLTATPDAGSTLAGWSEAACSNTQTTCTVVMDQEKTVTIKYNKSSPPTGVVIAPTTHNFQTLEVGKTLSQTFVVTNNTNSPITVETPQLTSANASEFSFQVQTCTTESVNATATCLIEVLFSPQCAGTKNALLEIPVTGMTALSVSMQADAIGAGECPPPPPNDCLRIEPTEQNFGQVRLYELSQKKQFIVTNLCDPHVAIDVALLIGTDADQFSIENDTCSGRDITPLIDGSCVVEVVFRPLHEIGVKNASLSIDYQIDYQGRTAQASLIGEALPSDTSCIEVTPPSKDFGTLPVSQSSAKQGFVVKNVCPPHLKINNVQLTGTDAGQFQVGNNTCTGRDITPLIDGSCVVEISFQPTTEGANKQAQIEIYVADDMGNPATIVPLTGSTGGPRVVQTLILTNYQKLASLYSPTKADQVISKLNELANHAEVQGLVIKVEDDPNIASFYASRGENYNDPDYANAVAEAIKQQIILNQWNGNLANVVIVGDDRIVPFYRLTDGTDIGPNNRPDVWTLTDNFYAGQRPIICLGGCVNSQFYIPEVAIGRLIETPAQIIAVIDTFLAKNTLEISQVAVTGYDFVKDGAEEQCKMWQGAKIQANCALIGEHWTPNDFIGQILNVPQQATSLNGHANYNVFGTPNHGLIDAEAFVNATTDFSRAIFYTVGCHAGQNVANALDLPESFATKKANYVANTGYGWGGTGVILSEKLMSNLTNELIKPSTTVTVGKALMRAKQQYYAEDPKFSPYDEKVVAESTLYGLPMYQVKSQAVASMSSGITAIRNLTTDEGGLQEDGYSYRWEVTSLLATAGGEENTFSLSGSIAGEDNKPILPKLTSEVSDPSKALRGIVFRGGSYAVRNATPRSQRYSTTTGITTPEQPFTAPNWYPAVFFTPNVVPLSSGKQEMLVATAGQYNPNLTAGQQRLFTNMDFGVYHHENANDLTAPTMSPPLSSIQDYSATVTVDASDASGIKEVVIAYTAGTGTWNSANLTRNGETSWTGSFVAAGHTEFFVQVVDNAGNVAVNDNEGKYFIVAGGLTDSLPELDAVAVNKVGNPVKLTTKFAGGIAVSKDKPQQGVIQSLSDEVNVIGEIHVDPTHIGQPADLFVYAEATFPPASDKYYYMLGDINQGLSILPWDEKPANLAAFMKVEKLGETQSVPMYQGKFYYAGTLKVHFGYRLEDGTVVTSGQPISIMISP